MEELDAIFQGSARGVTNRDLAEMKYLERVIKEALRLFPSVPFIGRRLTQDTQIGKRYTVHLTPDVWTCINANSGVYVSGAGCTLNYNNMGGPTVLLS